MDGTLAGGLKNWLGTQNDSYARKMLMGLSVACPLGQSGPHCPLGEIRRLPQTQRIAWVNAKTDEEIHQIYAQHYACLKERNNL